MAAAKRVADDTVRYYLFPKLEYPTTRLDRLELEKRAELYTAKLLPLITTYIWQDEQFNLCVVDAQRDGVPPHLEGSTYFGDNVEDEWFVVYLLYELTKDDKDLVVKVEDTDGEFLLIEAADHLPKWLNPETSENRVYIYRNSLHVVPLENGKASENTRVPRIDDAITIIRSPIAKTKATPAVQKSLAARLHDAPVRHRASHHRAHCYLPAAAVALLQRDPALLGPAVGAFVSRDPLDLKALRAMRHFPPETRVMAEVIFTRCLYAQLRQQRFAPDRRVGWNMPPPHAPEFIAHDLGLKLACGLEILAAGSDKTTVNGEPDLSELGDDVRWKRFLKSLSTKGYFQGELEGSKLYHNLLQRAREYFVHTVAAAEDGESERRGRCSAHARVSRQLRQLDVNVEKLREESEKLGEPDDEKWMEVTPQDLDRLLEDYSSRSSGGEKHKGAKPVQKTEETLGKTITESLDRFVRHVSGYEGAEVPSNAAAKGKSQSSEASHQAKADGIDFDPDRFVEALGAILDFKLPQSDDESSSSMSSYGDEVDSHDRLADIINGDDDSYGSDDEDGDLNGPGVDLSRLALDMKSYMELMDHELAGTNVGLSFERQPVAKPAATEEEADPEAKSLPPKAKEAPRATAESLDELDSDDDEEAAGGDGYRPIDVNLTALKNILESYSSQEGLPGPAGNLLSAMGISVPRNEDDQ
ncbi:ecdysoneless cell cycle regulator [Rhipicephalus microplus]|uniref:ecdysoneless cell cycle regulator n=1 Tax=Rhipicephalus microplus TaxID=6941 RepID=UPI00188909BF|nr:protein ecdysoneless homolog [Rhipicephalus microplus]